MKCVEEKRHWVIVYSLLGLFTKKLRYLNSHFESKQKHEIYFQISVPDMLNILNASYYKQAMYLFIYVFIKHSVFIDKWVLCSTLT